MHAIRPGVNALHEALQSLSSLVSSDSPFVALFPENYHESTIGNFAGKIVTLVMFFSLSASVKTVLVMKIQQNITPAEILVLILFSVSLHHGKLEGDKTCVFQSSCLIHKPLHPFPFASQSKLHLLEAVAGG